MIDNSISNYFDNDLNDSININNINNIDIIIAASNLHNNIQSNKLLLNYN